MKAATPKGVPVTQQDITNLKDKLTKVEERVYSHDEKFASQQTLIDSTSCNLKMISFTVNEHEQKLEGCMHIIKRIIIVDKLIEEVNSMKTRLDELEKMMKSLGSRIAKAGEGVSVAPSQGIDESQLESLISSLRIELMGKLTKQEDFNTLLKRVESLEAMTQSLNKSHELLKVEVGGIGKQTAENTEEINKLKERFKAFEEKLADKVNCEDYDKLLALIQQLQAGYERVV